MRRPERASASARGRVLVLLTLTAWCAAALPARADPIDDHVRAEMTRSSVPGLALAVIRDGQIVKLQGYGLADVERQVPVGPDTVFKIGSVSKPLLATGILRLVEDGRLSLGDPVSKFFEDAPRAWRGITIRHLLSHTSGLVREGPAFSPLRVQPDADVVKSAYPEPLRFPTGTKWEYCNVGYFALAEIISRVTGQSWPEFMRAQIFEPLGMTSTRPTDAKDPKRAVGYGGEGNTTVSPDWPAVRPSGAFLSTVEDLARWDLALTSGRVLRDDTRRAMWTPVRLTGGASHPYGLGWELGTRAGRRYAGHGGALPGFRSTFARFPGDGVTIILLTNADRVDRDAIVAGLMRALAEVPAGAAAR